MILKDAAATDFVTISLLCDRGPPIIVYTVSNLSIVLSRRGKYKEVEAMYRRDLEGYKKVFRPEYPGNITSVSNLSDVLFS